MGADRAVATTGSRIRLRFFGGWVSDEDDALRRDLALVGYSKGVPMGSDLPPATEGDTAPRFLVYALRDPTGANLDRVQIVKGWVDAASEMQERIYDVVWSGDREPGADGKLPPVGSTVDVENAIWTTTIGAPELITVWQDPDFHPSLKALLLCPRPRDPDTALDRL